MRHVDGDRLAKSNLDSGLSEKPMRQIVAAGTWIRKTLRMIRDGLRYSGFGPNDWVHELISFDGEAQLAGLQIYIRDKEQPFFARQLSLPRRQFKDTSNQAQKLCDLVASLLRDGGNHLDSRFQSRRPKCQMITPKYTRHTGRLVDGCQVTRQPTKT